MAKAEIDKVVVELEAKCAEMAKRKADETNRLIKERRNGKVMKTTYGTGGRGIFKVEADDPTGAMSFVADAEATLFELENDEEIIEVWDNLPKKMQNLLMKVHHQVDDAFTAYYSSENARVVMDDPDYNYLKDPEFDYLYTSKDEAIKNWPKWEDGTEVKIGEVAMSSRGPRTITGIELSRGGYTLWGRTDEVFDESVDDSCIVFNPCYIIDEGSFGEDGKQFGHPVREGEECDFWTGDEQDLEETKEIDIRDIAERVKRVSCVYGYKTNEAIEKVLEWI